MKTHAQWVNVGRYGIKEKKHTMIYTFNRKSSDQFSSFFFPKLSPEVDIHKIWVSLISVMKLQETSVTTYFANCFYYLLLIYIYFFNTVTGVEIRFLKVRGRGGVGGGVGGGGGGQVGFYFSLPPGF